MSYMDWDVARERERDETDIDENDDGEPEDSDDFPAYYEDDDQYTGPTFREDDS